MSAGMSSLPVHLVLRILAAIAAVAATQASAQPSPPPPPSDLNGAYPSVSPDGKRVAFISARGGEVDVYITTIEGDRVVRVTRSPATFEGPPQWVERGKALAFDTSVAQFSKSAVLVIPDSGGAARQLGILDGAVSLITRTDRVLHTLGTPRANRLYESDPDGARSRALTDSSGVISQMVYSADRSRIAYIRADSGRRRIFTMRSDGSDARPVAEIPTAEGRPERPAWSPNGRQLAFQVGIPDAQTRRVVGSHIWIVDLETGTTTKLAEQGRAYNDATPAWFPDGLSIAFTSDRTGKREVWMMSSRGENARQITK